MVKETYLVNQGLPAGAKIENKNKKLSHSLEKNRIEEVGSFDSIGSKGKHEKVFQDDIFGRAECSSDGQRWAYVAEIKQEEPKSYFNGGRGKPQYKHDLGETMEGVKETGIFVWDKKLKRLVRIPLDKKLIPCYVSFANEYGS